jgi:hypothetical protein
MILGWRSIFKIQISRVTLSMSACYTIFSFCRVLIATRYPVSRWVPSLTLPKVPSPMLSPNSLVRYRYDIDRWSGRDCHYGSSAFRNNEYNGKGIIANNQKFPIILTYLIQFIWIKQVALSWNTRKFLL